MFYNFYSYNESLFCSITVNTNLYRLQPFSDDVAMEHLGRFKLEGKNSCIVNSYIYHFGCDRFDDKSNIEVYDIKTKEFKIVWETQDTLIRLDNANGCFFLPSYCSWLVDTI